MVRKRLKKIKAPRAVEGQSDGAFFVSKEGLSGPMERMLYEFHKAADMLGASKHDKKVQKLRKRLITEEYKELIEAIDAADEYWIIKEACDLVYVTVGTCVQFNLPFDGPFRLVHKNNMSKSVGGKFTYDKGKVLKPVDYKPLDEAKFDKYMHGYKEK